MGWGSGGLSATAQRLAAAARNRNTRTRTPARPSGTYVDRSEQDWREEPAARAYFGVQAPGTRTAASWGSFRDDFATLPYNGRGFDFSTLGQQQSVPSYSGGGRGYGGGGGGGGGAPALTQATIDAMVRALGMMPQAQTYTDITAPAFQGQNIRAFDPTLYNQLSQNLQTGYNADLNTIAQNQAQTAGALSAAYSNPYANAQVAAAPPPAQVGAGMAGAAGVDPGIASAGEAQSQAAFQNLMNVLSANNAQSQQSRMQQVALDANTARTNLGAQRLGLSSQIGAQRAGAQEAWRQRDDERRYQNSLQQQQWARELAMMNAQGRQAVNQANVSTRNEAMMARLQPILDLIAQTNGVGGLNMNSLNQLLQRFGVAA